MNKRTFGKGASLCCYLSGVLAPLSWGFFTIYTRNTFHLEEFQAARMTTCLILSLAPLVLFFLARLLQRRCGFIWGELLACMFFLVAAACWLYTLVQGWPVWDAALAAGRLEAGQRQCLRITSVTGAVSAMIPLLAQIPGALKKH